MTMNPADDISAQSFSIVQFIGSNQKVRSEVQRHLSWAYVYILLAPA